MAAMYMQDIYAVASVAIQLTLTKPCAAPVTTMWYEWSCTHVAACVSRVLLHSSLLADLVASSSQPGALVSVL